MDVKVKGSRYRPGVAQRVGRGIALFFHYRGTMKGVSGQQHAPAALYPRERPGAHCTELLKRSIQICTCHLLLFGQLHF